MRLRRFLNEEDIVKKALSIDEPEVGEDYDESEAADNIDIIDSAINKVSGGESEADKNILSDLKDKKEKWSNWKKEVKSKGPNPSPDEVAIAAQTQAMEKEEEE
jgi:hypothetical protein